MLHIIIHRQQTFSSLQALDRHFILWNYLMASWVIFHSWNMLNERAVKNDLADREETPALKISACITPTRGITSRLPQSLKKREFIIFQTVPWNQYPVLLEKTRSICCNFILSSPKALFISPNHASRHELISNLTQHKNMQWDWFKSCSGFLSEAQ
jgi:hypothetical protein